MSPEARTEIIETLEKSKAEFNAAAGGLSDAQANTRPEAARWSVLECIEHVTAVEERFLKRLEKMETAPPPDKEKEAQIAARAADRSSRFEAPEPVRPAGRYATLAQALEGFNGVRTQSVQFAREQAERLYSLGTQHPRFGTLNGAELLMLLCGHSRRHAEQIRETRAVVEKL